MELVHKPIIERGEVFEALRTRFFQSLEEEDLSPRVQLFQEMAQLSHRIVPGRNTEDIVDEALDELLGEVLCGEVSLR
jgi:hypothetical protein